MIVVVDRAAGLADQVVPEEVDPAVREEVVLVMVQADAEEITGPVKKK